MSETGPLHQRKQLVKDTAKSMNFSHDKARELLKHVQDHHGEVATKMHSSGIRLPMTSSDKNLSFVGPDGFRHHHGWGNKGYATQKKDTEKPEFHMKTKDMNWVGRTNDSYNPIKEDEDVIKHTLREMCESKISDLLYIK
jgi:hypothetical protein